MRLVAFMRTGVNLLVRLSRTHSGNSYSSNKSDQWPSPASLAELPVVPVFEPVKVKVGVSTKSLVLEAKDVTHDIKNRKVEIEDGKDDFSVVQDPVDTAHTIEVSFKPQAAGVRTGKMLIQSNAEGSPHSIALQGEGREAIVRVDTNKLDFHSQKRKTHSDFLTWTIHNAGTSPWPASDFSGGPLKTVPSLPTRAPCPCSGLIT